MFDFGCLDFGPMVCFDLNVAEMQVVTIGSIYISGLLQLKYFIFSLSNIDSN